MAKILREFLEKHEAQFPNLAFLLTKKSMFRHYCIQNVKDGIQNSSIQNSSSSPVAVSALLLVLALLPYFPASLQIMILMIKLQFRRELWIHNDHDH